MYSSSDSLSDDEINELRKKLTERGLCGLENLGNTCYMNSIIQCLFAVDPFTVWLIKNKFEQRLQNNISFLLGEQKRKKNNIADNAVVVISRSELINNSENTIVYRLAELLKGMWKQNCFITPKSFKEVIGENSVTFRGYNQNDSQELLNLILDKIHEETKAEVEVYFPNLPEGVINFLHVKKRCNEIFSNKTSSIEDKEKCINNLNEYKKKYPQDVAFCNALNYWKDYIGKSHSIITDLFTGLFYSNIICNECESLSGSFEPFTILSVPTKEEGETSLYESIKEFSKEELLTGDNKYFCDTCKRKVNATKKMCIWEPPNILIIQLKRFKNDSYRNTKTSSKVVFPIQNFDIKDYLSQLHSVNNTIYDLKSISEHRGTCNFGHYVAYCKNSINKKWYEHNDKNVIHVPDDELANEIITKNAYILFYVRRMN